MPLFTRVSLIQTPLNFAPCSNTFVFQTSKGAEEVFLCSLIAGVYARLVYYQSVIGCVPKVVATMCT